MTLRSAGDVPEDRCREPDDKLSQLTVLVFEGGEHSLQLGLMVGVLEAIGPFFYVKSRFHGSPFKSEYPFATRKIDDSKFSKYTYANTDKLRK